MLPPGNPSPSTGLEVSYRKPAGNLSTIDSPVAQPQPAGDTASFSLGQLSSDATLAAPAESVATPVQTSEIDLSSLSKNPISLNADATVNSVSFSEAATLRTAFVNQALVDQLIAKLVLDAELPAKGITPTFKQNKEDLRVPLNRNEVSAFYQLAKAVLAHQAAPEISKILETPLQDAKGSLTPLFNQYQTLTDGKQSLRSPMVVVKLIDLLYETDLEGINALVDAVQAIDKANNPEDSIINKALDSTKKVSDKAQAWISGLFHKNAA